MLLQKQMICMSAKGISTKIKREGIEQAKMCVFLSVLISEGTEQTKMEHDV